MAQLRDLLVAGPSRFLGPVNFNDIITFLNNVVIDGNLSVKGNLTMGDASSDTHILNGKLGLAGNANTYYIDGSANAVFNALTAKGNIVLGATSTNTVTIKGATTYNANIYFNGTTYYIDTSGHASLNNLTAAGTSNLKGSVTIGDNTSDVHKVNGNLTHNGIVYFANGTTYYINNSGTAVLNALTTKGNTTIGDNTSDVHKINGNTTFNGNLYLANGTTYYIDSSANAVFNALTAKGNVTFGSTSTTTTATLNSKVILNKSESTGGLIIRRGTSDSEAIRIYNKSNYTDFESTNETLLGEIHFTLKNVDDANGGAGANTSQVKFIGDANGSEVVATKFTGSFNGNASSASAVKIQTATGNTDYAMVFTTATGATNTASLYADSEFRNNGAITYNPSNNLIKIKKLTVSGTTGSTEMSGGDLTVAGGVGVSGAVNAFKYGVANKLDLEYNISEDCLEFKFR